MSEITVMFSHCKHNHRMGTKLWVCINEECDGVHHYLVVAK